MPRPGALRLLFAALGPLALARCQSPELKASERLMPAVEALVAAVPPGDPKAFVHTAPDYLDAIEKVEAALRDGPHPPAGTPAAARLAPAAAWAEAARAENTALEEAFQKVLGAVEQTAHADLAAAVTGGPTRDAREMAEAMTHTEVRPIVLWHGTGNTRGFDEDHQHLPAPLRRAVDPGARFVVGYVQRVAGEGLRLVDENVVAEQKVAYVALYVMPARWRLGVFTVKGELGRLPTPPPPPGTLLPGTKPPVIESLLRAP